MTALSIVTPPGDSCESPFEFLTFLLCTESMTVRDKGFSEAESQQKGPKLLCYETCVVNTITNFLYVNY